MQNILRWSTVLCLGTSTGCESPDGPLVVHEWGTITTVHAPDGTPQGRLNRIDSADVLPDFVHRYEPPATGNDSSRWVGKRPLIPGRPDVTMRLETPVIYFHPPRDWPPNARLVDRRLPVRLLNYAWHRAQWPPLDRLVGAPLDLTHSPHPLLLPAKKAKRIVTLHDLFFLKHPDMTEAEIRRDYAPLVREHVRKADGVICVSEHTASEAQLLLDVNRTANGPAVRSLDELLADVGLAEFAGAHPHELSGGMQQRVALVRAMVLGAPLLLMDEPFAALDEITRTEMRHLLARLRSDGGLTPATTTLFVTHSVAEAVFLSDHIVVLTSRVSVEMVQKAATARAPIIVAVSAPTGLALRTADVAGITLVAVARKDGFEIFTHPERIENAAAAMPNQISKKEPAGHAA